MQFDWLVKLLKKVSYCYVATEEVKSNLTIVLQSPKEWNHKIKEVKLEVQKNEVNNCLICVYMH
jgi:hypothetical protein